MLTDRPADRPTDHTPRAPELPQHGPDQPTDTTEPEKKKPGRPRKKLPAAPAIIHGIVDKPANKDDIIELVYCNPTIFKKFLQLYKQFKVSELEMMFDGAGLRIVAKDHLNKSTIYSVIDGKCMNLYYCGQPIRVCVKRDNLERVLGTLGKNHSKITFILKENYRSTMYVIVKDTEYNRDDSYELDVVFKPENTARDDRKIDVDKDYPIKLKLSSKHFKTLVNNVKRLSPVLTLQKSGEEPVQFTFAKAQRVNWIGVYNDSSRIDLKSNIQEGEIFSVSVNVEYIHPFSNSNIGDEVHVAAHQTEMLSLMTFLDKKDIGHSAFVKVFTEIKDYHRMI
jgi:hypothetical protein